LDSENGFFDHATRVAGPDFIDLTLDSDDSDYFLEHRKSVANPDPYHASVIVLDDDEVQASTPFRAKSSSWLRKSQELELSDVSHFFAHLKDHFDEQPRTNFQC